MRETLYSPTVLCKSNANEFVESRPLFSQIFHEKSLTFQKIFSRVQSKKFMIFLENSTASPQVS